MPDKCLELLDGSIRYAVDAAASVTPSMLWLPTPCAAWDLRLLLQHINDSLAAIRESIVGYAISGEPATESPDVLTTFRARAAELLDGPRGPRRVVLIDGWPIPGWIVAATGAVEIAVHGWDIGRASARTDPIPAELATELLPICPLIVTAGCPAFSAPLPVPAGANPSDRLVALLGRTANGFRPFPGHD